MSGEVGQTDLVYDQRSLVGLCMQGYKTQLRLVPPRQTDRQCLISLYEELSQLS